MSSVNGVLGPIDTADLGFTLMHEHILIANWSMRMAFDDWVDVDEHVEHAAGELRSAAERGVRTMVDLTPVNLGRDIHVIREVAARAGVNVVAATGLYWTEEPWLEMWTADALVDWLIRDITDGIQGTDSKAGIIKCATDHPGLSPLNEKLLQVAARLHRKTGVPISTHTSCEHRTGLDQVRVFQREGVDLSRVVIGHCGDTDDLAYLEEILASGCTIGMDRFGLNHLLPMEKRVSTVVELCQRGHAGRMVLSHDACCHIDFFPGGRAGALMPQWNFRHIPDDVIPALRKEGLDDETIRTLTVDTPRRVFESQGAYQDLSSR
jgi:phosphotriesterase-related protein